MQFISTCYNKSEHQTLWVETVKAITALGNFIIIRFSR